jgi:hypothetical protein
MPKTPSYAVIFKAFTTDRFVMRQLARLCLVADGGDVYLMLDETAGPAGPVDFTRVIRFTDADLIARGFPPYAQGALLWYNADYPLYHFQHLHPEYDVVAMVEYDTVVQIDIGTMVRAFRAAALDFIGQPIEKPLERYWWTGSMRRFYDDAQIRPFLICFAVFSARAISHLAACRLTQSGQAAGVEQWPVGECFVGTELSAQRFRIQNLSASGRVAHYDWWPPVHEAELPDHARDMVLHPVLNGRRYIKSLFKNGNVTGCVAVWRLNLFSMALRALSRGMRLGGRNSGRL